LDIVDRAVAGGSTVVGGTMAGLEVGGGEVGVMTGSAKVAEGPGCPSLAREQPNVIKFKIKNPTRY